MLIIVTIVEGACREPLSMPLQAVCLLNLAAIWEADVVYAKVSVVIVGVR